MNRRQFLALGPAAALPRASFNGIEFPPVPRCGKMRGIFEFAARQLARGNRVLVVSKEEQILFAGPVRA